LDVFSLFSSDVKSIESILRNLVMSHEEGICTLALQLFAAKGARDALEPLLFASLNNSGSLPNALKIASDIGMVYPSTAGDIASIVQDLAKNVSFETLSKYIECGGVSAEILALAVATEKINVAGSIEWIVSFIETRGAPSRFVITDSSADFESVVNSGVASLAPRALSAILSKLGEGKIEWMNNGDNVDSEIAERVFTLISHSTELLGVFFSTVGSRDVLEFAAFKLCRGEMASGKGIQRDY
jgi:hypothetical protein